MAQPPAYFGVRQLIGGIALDPAAAPQRGRPRSKYGGRAGGNRGAGSLARDGLAAAPHLDVDRRRGNRRPRVRHHGRGELPRALQRGAAEVRRRPGAARAGLRRHARAAESTGGPSRATRPSRRRSSTPSSRRQRSVGPPAAAARLATGHNKATMDAIRSEFAACRRANDIAARAGRGRASTTASRRWTGMATGLLGVVISMASSGPSGATRRSRPSAAGGALRRARTAARDAGQHRRRRDRHRCRPAASRCSTASPSSSPAGRSSEAVGRAARRRCSGIVNEDTRQPVENPVTRALRDGVIVGLANHTVLIARDGTERPDRRQRRAHPRGGDEVARRRAGLPRRHRRSPGGDRAESLAGARAVVGRAPATGGRRVADHQRRDDPGQHRRGHRRRGAPDPRRGPLHGDASPTSCWPKRTAASWCR